MAIITDQQRKFYETTLEMTKQAAALRSDLCVLYASGGSPAEASTGLMLQGSHFLQKPYGDIQLQEALTKTLNAAPARNFPV